MRKFAVFSGFLGSGKTTTMMALAKKGSGTAMITNDLGAKGLADHKLAEFRQCSAAEITGDCICYQTEKLVENLERLFAEKDCELVISDIPGFGVGALEHVYHTLDGKYPGQYELAPFTVLVEPRTLNMLKEGGGDLAYILHNQLVEADLIVLNKCDLLDESSRADAAAYLQKAYPQAEAVTVSAVTGEGLETLRRILTDGHASMHRPDIGYGGEAFTKVMGQVCEYNLQYYATVCCDDFDGNAYLLALAEAVQERVGELQAKIPHMKLLAWKPEGEYAKADLLDVDRPVEVNQTFQSPCTELAVVLNASAFGSGSELDAAITAAVEQVSRQYQLDLVIYRKEVI